MESSRHRCQERATLNGEQEASLSGFARFLGPAEEDVQSLGSISLETDLHSLLGLDAIHDFFSDDQSFGRPVTRVLKNIRLIRWGDLSIPFETPEHDTSVVEVFLPETRCRDLGQRSRHREQEIPFLGDTGFVDDGVVNVDAEFVRFQLPLELF